MTTLMYYERERAQLGHPVVFLVLCRSSAFYYDTMAEDPGRKRDFSSRWQSHTAQFLTPVEAVQNFTDDKRNSTNTTKTI